jgi:hypothetical protein
MAAILVKTLARRSGLQRVRNLKDKSIGKKCLAYPYKRNLISLEITVSRSLEETQIPSTKQGQPGYHNC